MYKAMRPDLLISEGAFFVNATPPPGFRPVPTGCHRNGADAPDWRQEC
jgi:hypothetical protein